MVLFVYKPLLTYYAIMDVVVPPLCDVPGFHRSDTPYPLGSTRKSSLDSLSFQVRRLNKALGYQLRQLFESRNLDLTMDQWMILTALSTQKGVNQMQVGDSCFRDKASITRLLDMLEAKQWVYRQTDTRDRRTKLVYLTPEGAEVREQALAIALLSTALHILTRFGDHLENADSD